MEKTWQELLTQSVKGVKALKRFANIDEKQISRVIHVYPMKINPYYLGLIDINDPNDPIAKEAIPDIRETDLEEGKPDILNEEKHRIGKTIIHKYENRVLFLVSTECAMYCRFCTRKRKVGTDHFIITKHDLDEGIRYIENNEKIRDVLLSGGDPLILSNNRLEYILKKLRTIKHVDIIRIGTRIPVTLPQRIDEDLVIMLKKYHPIFINTHFNHPKEITKESTKACNLLADAGIPLGNQTVLLKGVNDKPEIMAELMQSLLKIRVKPYYIYQADYIKGTEHFRTTVETGIQIIDYIRKHCSGLAVPQFVIDAPNGYGKIPILPQYIVELNDNHVILNDYYGNKVVYPQVSRVVNMEKFEELI